MSEGIEDIIQDIVSKSQGIDSLIIKYPKSKNSEISKKIVQYYIDNNYKKTTAEGLSKATGIPLSKAKNLISNPFRNDRNNNIKTLQILTQYLDNLDEYNGDKM